MTKIKKVGVLSLAKVQGLLGAIMGLIVGILFGLMFGLMGLTAGSGEEAAFGLLFGAGFGILGLIMFPIIYGVLGFISGLILASLYNIVASWVGGLEIELEE
jgi:hypothetical protein